MERRTARQRARHHVTLAVGLLVVAAFTVRLGLPPLLLLLLVAYAAAAAAWWAVAAWRDPKPDPWAYDPELDGPVAEAMEGRSYLRPPGPPPAPRPAAQTWLFLLLAALFAVAGGWLVAVANATYGGARGAEAPALSALAFYLFAASFLAASPWLAWHGLRRAR
ncbi:MAG: hypothetical protein LC620_00795 [Halobacteriales archaeon]|nr:hypothetical protein [Halobacteriales archaeon]